MLTSSKQTSTSSYAQCLTGFSRCTVVRQQLCRMLAEPKQLSCKGAGWPGCWCHGMPAEFANTSSCFHWWISSINLTGGSNCGMETAAAACACQTRAPALQTAAHACVAKDCTYLSALHRALFIKLSVSCYLQFIIGLGVAIAFAAAVPKLGATKGYIRAGVRGAVLLASITAAAAARLAGSGLQKKPTRAGV
jgi:hypothetical protein